MQNLQIFDDIFEKWGIFLFKMIFFYSKMQIYASKNSNLHLLIYWYKKSVFGFHVIS